MSALDQIHDLENKINDAIKRGAELKLKKAQTEDNIVKIKDAIEGAQLKVTYHGNNRRHMMTVADHVNLPEYMKTATHLEKAQTTLSDAKQMLATSESTIRACDDELAQIDRDIAAARDKLATYGQVIPFQVRAAA